MNHAALKERILARAAELAGVPRQDVRQETELELIGLDSSDAVILAMEAEEYIGQDVDVGIFLRFTAVGEAVDDLLARLERGMPLF